MTKTVRVPEEPGGADSVPQLRHLVSGRWSAGSGGSLVDTNPARPQEVVATGRLAGSDDLDAAVASARAAFPAWSATPHPARGRILARAGDILDRRSAEWGAELAREEGKTLAEGIGEVRRAAEVCHYHASEGSRAAGEIFASSRAGEQIQVIHRPVGTVAVVTPFNFPIAIPAWKIAPALGYGNTVVWKPASTVPLLAVRLAEALVEAGLPEGVLSLLIADGDIGQQLVAHPGVDAVTFTGSTSVGRRLIETCGRLMRPVQTELGGKNAAAVLADADLDLAVDEVLAGAFRSAGQKCTATSRLIVTDAVADEFLTALVAGAEGLRVGDPLLPDVLMGPVVTTSARDEIQAVVDASTERESVRVLTGARRYTDEMRRTGAFLPPTVVEVTGESVLWREEVFGPVLTVRRARDDQEALELVNDSAFGLSAALFTDNLRAVTSAIEQLEVGVLHINSETAGAEPHVPFGGAKHSGFGPREQGRAAREFFTTSKTVYLRGSGTRL
ncbi:aldehyde dehydrogenase family protein [Amycolatopsis ultiminotia]|uniref:Aldehyde dehydrogenase family protein n=1 Tax=Amycolatopsis ultiminotia TaxID=543629 RepID=A0ABP6WKG7_9PSEU